MADEEDEEEELAQWMPECDDCDNLAEHICKTCGDKLCTGCKDQHLSRKKNRHHEVDPYSSGVRHLKNSKSTCTKHPGERYQMYCKPCQSSVCSLCVTQSHADFNHAFISIADVFSDAKDKATTNLEKMTKIIQPALKDYSEKVKESAANARASIDETEKIMRRSATLLHEEVDHTLEEHLKQLQKIREESISPVLQAKEQNGQELQTKLQLAVKEYEKRLRSDDPIDLIKFMKEKGSDDPESLFPIPVSREVPLPMFHPGIVERKSLKDKFGSLLYQEKKTNEVSS